MKKTGRIIKANVDSPGLEPKGNLPASAATREYASWLAELKLRYRSQQLKAAVQVNGALLEFYWKLGHDIVERDWENVYGSGFFRKLSVDLTQELPDAKGLSPKNLWYTKRFYLLYSPILQQKCLQINELQIFPQPGGKLPDTLEDRAILLLFCIPWGHHRLILDKCSSSPDKALFYVQKTAEFNWSRSVLMNFIDTDLYEREGKAVSNFKSVLPQPQGDLAQEMTRDPYKFNFLTIEGNYLEKELKEALITNITKFLLDLGNGFA